MRVLQRGVQTKALQQIHMAKNRSGDGMLPAETFEKISGTKVDVNQFVNLKRLDSENEKFPIKVFEKQQTLKEKKSNLRSSSKKRINKNGK